MECVSSIIGWHDNLLWRQKQCVATGSAPCVPRSANVKATSCNAGSTKSPARKAGRTVLPTRRPPVRWQCASCARHRRRLPKLSAERDDRQGVKLMRRFPYGFKNTIAAVAFSSVIAGGVCAATGLAVTGSEPSIKTSVDRTHKKSDRLPQAGMRYQSPNNSSSTEIAPRSRKLPPLGCDSAFSPITAPSLAHIFQRCMA